MTQASIEEEKKGVQPEQKLVLSDAEKQYHGAILKRMTAMRDDREKPRPHFNGMSYSQWDKNNQLQDMSYIPPARNKGEVRIVTGHTREKVSTLVSTALSFNFDGNVVAYDHKDQIIDEVGENIEDIVLKTREMEDYESKRPLYYRSIVSRGTSYVMESWESVWGVEKDLPEGYAKGKLDVDWHERLVKLFERAETRLYDPAKVFLGNMEQFFMQKQPDVALIEVLPYSTAMAMFQSWDRWKFVPRTKEVFQELQTTNDGYFGNTMGLTELNNEEVEVCIYMKKDTNELAIYLNKIPMLPIKVLSKATQTGKYVVSGFPLTCISPSGDYPIAKGDFEPVENFAISKGTPSKTYMDQNVLDMATKLLIEGMQSIRNPALGNNTGRLLTRKNFIPGTITDDIPREKLFPLIEGQQGLQPAEFSFYQLFKEQLEAKSVSAQFEGQQAGDGSPTATQVMEDKKQQILKLGLALDSIVRFERDLWYLRIRNFLANGTKAAELELDATNNAVKEIFRKFTVEKPNTGKGKKQRKQIEFKRAGDLMAMKEKDPTGDYLHEMELHEGKKLNMEVRHVYMDPVALRNLKAVWRVLIVPNAKKDDLVAKMLFVQNINDAVALFGPESLQVEKLKQRFAAVIGENPDDWFKDEGQMALLAAQQAQEAARGGGAGTGVAGGAPRATPQAPQMGVRPNTQVQKPGMQKLLQR